MKYIPNPVEVDAEEIVSVGPVLDDGSMHLALRNGTNCTVDAGMLARFTPAAGDFVVTQADGYVYINPRDVFLRKYHPTLETTANPWWGSIMPADEVEGPKAERK